MKKTLPRIIPCLLLKNTGFVKTTQFQNSRYLGDPINILKIFNEKEVDEIFVLDISATPAGRAPNLDMIGSFASECFMPLGYGGGITSIGQAEEILSLGVEKVCLNTSAHTQPALVTEIAKRFGSQAVVVAVDARKKLFGGHETFSHCGTRKAGMKPADAARHFEQLGAGEILIQSIDQDGAMNGYDLALIQSVSKAVQVPVIALGGCGKINDLVQSIDLGGATATAAGSFFVYHGPHRAVLIQAPTRSELKKAFQI